MAARSRNQPRPGLAWLIALAILLLILAAARAAAADPALARAYADAMSACDAGCREADDAEEDEEAEDDDDDDGGDEDDSDDEPSGRASTGPRRDDRFEDEPSAGARVEVDEPRVQGEILDVDDPNLVETGLLAADDEPPTADAIDTGAALASAAFVDAAELAEAEPRHRSRWGRIDLAISWRRNWTDTPTQSTRGDTIWLVATWRR